MEVFWQERANNWKINATPRISSRIIKNIKGKSCIFKIQWVLNAYTPAADKWDKPPCFPNFCWFLADLDHMAHRQLLETSQFWLWSSHDAYKYHGLSLSLDEVQILQFKWVWYHYFRLGILFNIFSSDLKKRKKNSMRLICKYSDSE